MKLAFNRSDLAWIIGVLVVSIAAWLFRDLTIVPRAYVALCANPHAPWVCVPRHAVLWAQFERLFGLGALLLGMLALAFARRALGAAALALGIVAVINYNGTEGIIGAALGLWGWLDARSPRYYWAKDASGDKNARQ